MRTLWYFQKSFFFNFWPEKVKKLASKVAHTRPRPFFFSAAPTAQNRPELHFRFINSSIQSSLLRSLFSSFKSWFKCLIVWVIFLHPDFIETTVVYSKEKKMQFVMIPGILYTFQECDLNYPRTWTKWQYLFWSFKLGDTK